MSTGVSINMSNFTPCVACSNSLCANYQRKNIDAAELQRINTILDSIEGVKSTKYTAARVKTIRNLFSNERKEADGKERKRCEYCLEMRLLLKKRFPTLFDHGFTSFEGLKTFVDWSCGEGEELRKKDAKEYDLIFTAFAWCAKEELELKNACKTPIKKELQMLF